MCSLEQGFVISGVRFIGVLLYTFNYYWAGEYRSLYRGLRYGVRYIGVSPYMGKPVGSRFAKMVLFARSGTSWISAAPELSTIFHSYTPVGDPL